jgi:hydroxyacylglutathione hydrolase
LSVIRGQHRLTPIVRLLAKAKADSCTTGKSTIGDEKKWNVFMRLDTPEAK